MSEDTVIQPRTIKQLLMVWAAISTLASMALTAGFLVVPYYTKAEAADALANQRKVDSVQNERLDQVESKLSKIEKQGSRSLELQLRASKRSLEQDLAKMSPGSPGRQNIEQQLDAINTDLETAR